MVVFSRGYDGYFTRYLMVICAVACFLSCCLQVIAGPHKGKTLQVAAGGAEVRVGRGAPGKNGLRLDKDFEISDRCDTTYFVPPPPSLLPPVSIKVL